MFLNSLIHAREWLVGSVTMNIVNQVNTKVLGVVEVKCGVAG